MKIGMRFALAIVSVILVVSLAANGYQYFSENSNLRKQTTDMQNQINSLQSQVTDMQNQTSRDSNTIDALNSQIANLLQENDNLQKENYNLTSLVRNLQNKSSSDFYEPHLVTSLGAKYISGLIRDNSSDQSIPQPTPSHWLYIKGFVSNLGNGTAYNCDLKVTYHTPSATYVYYYRFNALAPGENVTIDTNIFHDNIQSWEIIPECTNTP
jgi:hypothetical protein